MIDLAISGIMMVQDAGVLYIMQGAITEFHYQPFTSVHRGYYYTQELEALDDCRTVADVGWLKRLVGSSVSNRYRPPNMYKLNLAEIDISNAYTGASIEIKRIHLVNEFGTWHSYNAVEPFKYVRLHIV